MDISEINKKILENQTELKSLETEIKLYEIGQSTQINDSNYFEELLSRSEKLIEELENLINKL
jgi:hypothetical protein